MASTLSLDPSPVEGREVKHLPLDGGEVGERVMVK
jgi:hypothetical protein